MGFLSNLGKSIVKGITQGTNEGLNKLISTATQYGSSGDVSGIFTSSNINDAYGDSVKNTVINNEDFRSHDSKKMTSNILSAKNTYNAADNIAGFNTDKDGYAKDANGNVIKDTDGNALKTTTDMSSGDSTSKMSTSSDDSVELVLKYIKDDKSDELILEAPDWNYADLINERAIFQKGISSLFNDPLYCYFKIFFKFNTNYGLLGGILANSKETGTIGTLVTNNTASRYLHTMCAGVSSKMYKQEKPKDRLEALNKFVKLLSYISTNAPWMFKSVKGLENAENPVMTEFSKEKSISIDLNPDAIDMKLTTLFSLYRYACYDTINCKEIIPENLRKFDMMISIFSMPLRYIHTSMRDNNSSSNYKYKTMSTINTDWSHVMSYRMYTFKNCEIDLTSLGSLYSGTMESNNPFDLSSGSLKINYDKCYVSHCNEFFGLAFGDDGFYNNQYDAYLLKASNSSNDTEKRIKSLAKAWNTQSINANPSAYNVKAIVDASEALATNNLIKVQGYNMGNIYGEKNVIGKDSFYGYPGLTSLGDGIHREYYKTKLEALKHGTLYNDTSMHDIITNNGNYNIQSNKIWKNLGNAIKNAWNSGAY